MNLAHLLYYKSQSIPVLINIKINQIPSKMIKEIMSYPMRNTNQHVTMWDQSVLYNTTVLSQTLHSRNNTEYKNISLK